MESQTRRRTETGDHVIQSAYEKPQSVIISESNLSHEDQPDTGLCSGDISTSSPTDTTIDNLIGADDDALIPTPDEVNRIFNDGRATWMQFVKLAEALPPGTLPAGLRNPSIALRDIPALPERLPTKGLLVGQPLWYIPDPDPDHQRKHVDQGDEAWDPAYVCGIQKEYYLSASTPIECRISSAPGFMHFGHSEANGQSATPEGLSLLTLCWSYILSVRFWELQGTTALYTSHFLQPQVWGGVDSEEHDVVLLFENWVSPRLIRWLCAILAPKPGWSGPRGSSSPWAAFCSGDARFVISTDGPITLVVNEQPPNSDEATEFLIELCSLYGLGYEERQSQSEKKDGEPLCSPTAAFFAALSLPFYRHVDLQPQFSVPTLTRSCLDASKLAYLRQYVSDLRYYMTLSLHPRSLGSVIWSIFWQPEIECNVVSPWLASISSVIERIIHARDMELMAKTFAFRRPRVALWWLGIFLLGNPDILDMIANYLETLEERWGYGSMASPDISAAAWIGSPQSFLDGNAPDRYPDSKCQVARADVLRHRYNLRLRDTSSLPLSWRPFGYVSKDDVEPELWPHLEDRSSREYVHWVWWVKKDNTTVSDVQRGFREDTGRFTDNIPDYLEVVRTAPQGVVNYIRLAPSKQSTLRMIHYCLADANGDHDNDVTAVDGANGHPWLKYWRGVE